MHGVISPMMISPGLHDAVGRRMKRLIVIVGYHHAEIVFGAERAHAVLDDGGQLVFFQSGTRVVVQRFNAGVGDLRRAPESLDFESALRARHGFDNVFGIDRRLLEIFCNLVVQIDVHRFSAD